VPPCQSIVEALVSATGAVDPISAVRLKAAEAVERFCSVFGEPEYPLNIEALASLLGISISDKPPTHSRDAELVPKAGGRVEIRVREDGPETRKRFSIGHEISHTFFPGYEVKTWCRTDSRYRRRDNPDDLIEALCDVGSSHLLMPSRWFEPAAEQVTQAADLVELASYFGVSREALLRRYAEGNSGSCAAVFFSWKLKPVQQRRIGNRNQLRLIGTVEEEVAQARKLRVDYSIASEAFSATNRFIPNDKSVSDQSVLYATAVTNRPTEGACYLDLGSTAEGLYRVLAVPLWTPEEDRGLNGESSVGAIISVS
jgi:Zn-dependent peptidase ImmA (M78 family)